MSRRGLLTAAAGVVGAAGLVVEQAVQAPTAEAAAGEGIIIGAANDGGDAQTYLSSTSSGVAFGGLSTQGTGIYGDSESYYGVRGTSDSSVGVGGASSSGTGVSATSNSGAGVSGKSTSGLGVYGGSSSNHGVLGVSTSKQGVYGRSEKSVGVVAEGGLAPLRLVPASTTGKPTSGTHQLGELFVDKAGALYLCTTAGKPGTWKKVTVS